MAHSAESKALFSTIFDSVVSPDNKWLAACSTYGDIFIWNICSILQQNKKKTPFYSNHTRGHNLFADEEDEDDTDNDIDLTATTTATASSDTAVSTIPNEHKLRIANKPLFVFRPYSSAILQPIYRLSSMNELLLVGTFDSLYIYDWKRIISAIRKHVHVSTNMDAPRLLNIAPMHKYIPPQIEYKYGAKSRYVEINSIANNNQRNSVFLGTGHSNIFHLDLNTLKLIDELKEHQDYILDLSINSESNLLTSASHDGTLKVWSLASSNHGKSIVSFNDDKKSNEYYTNCCDLHENGRFAAAGYGHKTDDKRNQICLYELNMMTCIFTEANSENHYIPQVVKFSNVWKRSHQSNLSMMVGYNNCNLSVFDPNYSHSNHGKQQCDQLKIRSSSKSIWSIRFQKHYDMAVICGTSNCIDLVANTGNTITSLTV